MLWLWWLRLLRSRSSCNQEPSVLPLGIFGGLQERYSPIGRTEEIDGCDCVLKPLLEIPTLTKTAHEENRADIALGALDAGNLPLDQLNDFVYDWIEAFLQILDGHTDAASRNASGGVRPDAGSWDKISWSFAPRKFEWSCAHRGDSILHLDRQYLGSLALPMRTWSQRRLGNGERIAKGSKS